MGRSLITRGKKYIYLPVRKGGSRLLRDALSGRYFTVQDPWPVKSDQECFDLYRLKNDAWHQIFRNGETI